MRRRTPHFLDDDALAALETLVIGRRDEIEEPAVHLDAYLAVFAALDEKEHAPDVSDGLVGIAARRRLRARDGAHRGRREKPGEQPDDAGGTERQDGPG